MLVACGEDSDIEDCAAVIDTVSIIDKKTHNDKVYYLAKRITGWQDKSVIIQLFDHEPKNDRCHRSLIPPIIEDSLLPRTPVKSFEIDLENKIFIIEYVDNLDADDGIDDFTINFKKNNE